jgi:hypothetical protein
VIHFNIILLYSSRSPKWSHFIQVFRPRCSNFSVCHVSNPFHSSVSIINIMKIAKYRAPPNFVSFPSSSYPCWKPLCSVQ